MLYLMTSIIILTHYAFITANIYRSYIQKWAVFKIKYTINIFKYVFILYFMFKILEIYFINQTLALKFLHDYSYVHYIIYIYLYP